jgi:Terminase small subunit
VENSAHVHGNYLLNNPKVLAKIRARQNIILQRQDISTERVLREAACVAFLDPAQIDEGLSGLPEEARRALTGLEIEAPDGTVRKLRFASKMQALEFLAKHLGMLHGRVEVTGKSGGPISIVALRDSIRDLLLREDKPAALLPQEENEIPRNYEDTRPALEAGRSLFDDQPRAQKPNGLGIGISSDSGWTPPGFKR